MNEKFFALPLEKQERIINAGFHVFAQNSYKKSPVQEIALEAGVSKSLLFHYFKNKKELYLFLWKKAEQITLENIHKHKDQTSGDFFENMYSSLVSQLEILKVYPDIMRFSIRDYYEDDPDIKDEVRKQVAPYTRLATNKTLISLNPEQFKEGLDLEKMYKFIYLASEGYLWQLSHNDDMDVDKVVKGYKELIDFWKTLFLKDGGSHEFNRQNG